jgi:hypothetical protein
MEKHKFPGSRVYDMDETGISIVQTPSKLLGPKGQKQAGSLTSWERGKDITICMAMNATGSFAFPMFIFPRLRCPTLEKGGPEGSIYRCPRNSWINEENFMAWLEHFCKFVKISREEPILLIIDSHGFHKTFNAFNFCRDKYIVVLTIPPHASHRPQPVDLTFFSPLKTAYNRECDLFVKANGFEKIRPDDVASLSAKPS